MPEEKEPQVTEPKSEEEKKHEGAYRFLTNLPEGLEASNWQLREWAKQYNETICIKREPNEEVDGWYFYFPDGKREKIAPRGSSKPNSYLVYYSNGEVRLSRAGPRGIEVRYATKYKIPSTDKEEL